MRAALEEACFELVTSLAEEEGKWRIESSEWQMAAADKHLATPKGQPERETISA